MERQTTSRSGTKSERVQLRASPTQRRLLAAASQSEGTTLSDFVLKHAILAAEEVLADRRTFAVSPEQWRAFNDALDRPEREHPRLRKLLETPTVLD